MVSGKHIRVLYIQHGGKRMVTKTFGIVILLSAAFYYSYSRQWVGQQKCLLLEELCALMDWIQKNIECFAKPLDEICQDYTSPQLEQYGFYDQWQTEGLLCAMENLPYLTDTAKEVLLPYGKTAGQGYKEEELRLCRYTKEQLSEILRKQKEDLHAKNRMYRTLPFLLVLSIVLLLY